uniref:Uncharacterized protein n=1 Tax=Thermus caliditerrae TaxID=1330700 RepID=A0A7C5RFA1_9DEIN
MSTPSLEEAYLRRVLGSAVVAFTPGDPALLTLKPFRGPAVSLKVRLDPDEVVRFGLGVPAPSANDLVFPFILASRSLAGGLKSAGRCFAWGRPFLWALLRPETPLPPWVPLVPAELVLALEIRRASRLLAVLFSRKGEPVYLYLSEAFRNPPLLPA